MQSKDITSWAHLAELIEQHGDGQWIFRGVTNLDHELIPKVARPHYLRDWRGEKARREFDVTLEERALRMFQKAARPYLPYEPPTDLDWLAVAQHHGMPTRLLDWTESFLVAAYFAVEASGITQTGERVDAVIYAVRGLDHVTPEEARTPFAKLKELKQFKPPHISPRIPAQRSVFTAHPDPRKPVDVPSLKRFTIPSNLCFELKWILDACAINQGSLFPGLDGLAANILWRYKWNKLPPAV